MYHKKTLDKIISISKDVKPPLYRFLKKSQCKRIDGYSHIMAKTTTLKIFFLPSAIRYLMIRIITHKDYDYLYPCLRFLEH